MPTWKKKDKTGEMHFLHLCGDCHLGFEVMLHREGWEFLRGGEPVACSECTRKCRLTAEGLWGAGDEIRYQVCGVCPEYGVHPQGTLLLLMGSAGGALPHHRKTEAYRPSRFAEKRG